MHPTGPQPPKVYWVRRALVLGVIVLLLVAVAWLLGGRGGAATGALSGPSASPSPSHPAATSHAPTPTPTTATSRTPSASASTTTRSAAPTVAATPACTTSQLTVTASTDAASYPVGATPHLRMRIENTSSKACTRDLGAAQNELTITSGSAHVWSSDDCNPGGTPQVETLAPGQPAQRHQGHLQAGRSQRHHPLDPGRVLAHLSRPARVARGDGERHRRRPGTQVNGGS
jgi:hypothetical protein